MRSSKRQSRRRTPATLLEIWRNGLSLHEAWWIFGDSEQKEQYRNASHNAGLTAFLHSVLHRDLIDQLERGELSAVGVQVAPNVGDGPEVIPSFVFHLSEVDWDKSAVRAYGRAYDTVKVVRREELGTTKVPPAPAPSARPKRLGRPSVDSELREVVRELASVGELDGQPRQTQEYRVRVRAQQRYPNLFPPPRPSRTKILEALKAEGF